MNYSEHTRWISRDGRWKVVDGERDGRRARFLLDKRGRLHSGVALDGPPIPVFQYAQAMLRAAVEERSRRILVLGAGGFSVPTAVSYFCPDCLIHTVDRDGELEEVAGKYFFKPADTNMRFFTCDAVDLSGFSSGFYDLVLIDVFGENGLASIELFNLEWMTQLTRVLAGGGIVLWNMAMGRGAGWEMTLGRVLATGVVAGMTMEAFVHNDQSGSFYRNVLLSHPLHVVGRGNGGGGYEGWHPVGGRAEGDVLRRGAGFSWPDEELHRGRKFY